MFPLPVARGAAAAEVTAAAGGKAATAAATPGKRTVNVTPATPTNLRDWTGQQGLGVEWDPVPGAQYYRAWRDKRYNGQSAEKTIWGGSTTTQYVDTFQHYDSTPSERKQYAYSIVAVDAAGNQSAQSAAWVMEHGQSGHPDPAGFLDTAEEGNLSIA